ncbi:hypothetical protein PC118_g4503 [Phytophthora cactorum]|uniref:Uncharacterized protein n=1 Tax=Phytophthora cactorum TaxID=29920 RepID=A0A8T1GB64_9STRA|nr:hypothetical protein PC118_g4503 [Phytophthora cactorum]
MSLGDLVRRRALKVTKECTALTEQSCLTHHVVNVLHSLHKGGKGSGRAVHDHRELTKELHSDSSRADIKVKQVTQAEGGEHPAKSNEEASNAADK